MGRTPSVLFRQAAYRKETGEVPVLLLTLTHTSLVTPIRVSTDNKDTFVVDGVTVRGTISGGLNYLYCPMNIVLPDDSDDSISEAQIEIDNVDRDILAAIRGLTSAPTITIQAVLASTPNTVEAQFPNFKLSGVQADALTISGRITLGGFLGEPFPGGSMTPSNFPGLF